MHEVSIAEGILSAVESTLVNEPDAKVSSVTVNIGELAGVESQALLFAWDSVVRQTCDCAGRWRSLVHEMR